MTAGDKRDSDSQNEEFDWSVDNEVHLFMAMADSKPAGINKHFYMVDIAERFSALVGRDVPSSIIWKHLNTLYDMKMCDDIEGIPFPNEVKDFSLPEAEFGQLMKAKLKAVAVPNQPEESEGDRAISPKQQIATPRSTSRGASTKDTATPKVSKKDQANEKSNKRDSESSSGRPSTPAVDSTPSKAQEKESKQDIRRDSKDSNASSKESSSSKSTGASKTPAKDTKGSKSKRESISDKADDSKLSVDDTPLNKRGVKRPLRGSLKPEEQKTPPVRRRRI